MSLRIIAGALRGQRIHTPTGKGTRPTSDRVREALFSMVAARTEGLAGAAVLDLFAGSGALGLEALSRGAASCTLVDNEARVTRVVRENATRLELLERCRILTMDAGAALGLLRRQGAAFSLVLADPPYTHDSVEVLRWITEAGVLQPGGLLVLEHDARKPPGAPCPGLEQEADRRHGDTGITLYRAAIPDLAE